ncbi:MAG: putative adenine phosphoribosyltransferase, partial [Solirubrobacteraceae bacterium]|nr:putative adenine phosphoribosyltransferase [Solirubrobacteraceae bacterium]
FEASWSSGAAQRREGFVARVASDRPLYLDADIEVHAKIYEALADVPGVPVPRVYGYEPDPGLLGAPFFVMERMSGEVPGDNPSWRTEGFVIDAPPARRRAMWESAVDVLAALHQVDVSKFPFLAAPTGVSGLAHDLAHWRYSLDDASPGAVHETLERGYEWLAARLPSPEPTGFSWGDSRFANIMFRDDRVVSVFDWDTASLAGSEADLAWWRFMDGSASDLEGIGTADELVLRWEERTGRKVQHLEWHEVFTMFRLGVIMVRLFAGMAADGTLPPDVAAQQGRESGPAMALRSRLDELG